MVQGPTATTTGVVDLTPGGTATADFVLTDAPPLLAAVTVVGTRTDLDETRARAAQVPGAVSVVGPEEIRSSRQANVKDVLQFTPGIYVQPRIIPATWTWTGTLPPERFVEFPFVAVNPREATRLVWPVHQTYADGERVAWTGPEDGDEPASVTTIGTAGADSGREWTRYVSVGALALALISLALSLRRRAEAA